MILKVFDLRITYVRILSRMSEVSSVHREVAENATLWPQRAREDVSKYNDDLTKTKAGITG